MKTKPIYQLFPVEDNSRPCYNDYGAKDVQDAAGKGVPILCCVPNDIESVRLDSLSEEERLFIELIRCVSLKPSISELLIVAQEQ